MRKKKMILPIVAVMISVLAFSGCSNEEKNVTNTVPTEKTGVIITITPKPTEETQPTEAVDITEHDNGEMEGGIDAEATITEVPLPDGFGEDDPEGATETPTPKKDDEKKEEKPTDTNTPTPTKKSEEVKATDTPTPTPTKKPDGDKDVTAETTNTPTPTPTKKSDENEPTNTPTPTEDDNVPAGDNAKVKSVVDLAKSKIGSEFKTGGVGPDTFDNPGLVYYCFKENGVSVPRLASGMAKFGKEVSMKNLQAGDIVVFSNEIGGSADFVGIYIGNNSFVCAFKPDKPADVRTMSTYWTDRFISGRRVL